MVTYSSKDRILVFGANEDISTPLLHDLVWFHAVNSIGKVDQLIASLSERVLKKQCRLPIPIAIELDIHCVNLDRLREVEPKSIHYTITARHYPSVWSKNAQDAVCCCPGDVAVTRHDAAPPSTSSSISTLKDECTLHDLLECLRDRLIRCTELYHAFVVHVIKLDTKSPRALRATYYEVEDLHLIEKTFPNLHKGRVWYNADVLRGPIPPPPPLVTTMMMVSPPPSREGSVDNTLTDSVHLDPHVDPPPIGDDEDNGMSLPQARTIKGVEVKQQTEVHKNIIDHDEANWLSKEAYVPAEGEEYLYLSDLSVKDPFTKWAYDEMVRWLVRIGHQSKRGLSLGWTTQPDVFDGYTEDDGYRMRRLLEDMQGGPAPLITFPVRYSLVFPSADRAKAAEVSHKTASMEHDAESGGDLDDDALWRIKQQAPVHVMQQLLLSVAANGFATCAFLTFWRGRVESIDEQDVKTIHRYFPTATVDRD
ncbi:Hypothetical protein, putative [Bodo saltans]|uniref:Uncharacterized protein n=1 Tax=Bodo saltans TaxID=75058 RepID=A0A0S4KH04_BODSA|nr:Hypothetical protein, putative [Bodo saltans]|eukprot:CUI14892.1 Hypothetical protein, putative [Bodo saltans]